MADWYGNRHDETYEYIRVAWDNWQEHEAYGFITSGSLELSTDSDLKVTGNFSFEGDAQPNTDDLVRVYYSFTDDDGETERVPLATLFWSFSAADYFALSQGMKTSGNLDGVSVLSVLRDDLTGLPLTIPRNANPIYEAVKIIKDHGLNVDFTPSVRVLSADYTFPAGTPYLDIVNWLCDTAGYTQAFPDALGTVQLRPYVDVQLRTDAIVFSNDDKSIMYPEVNDATNIDDTYNVVRLVYNTDDSCVSAYAKNLTGSRSSLDVRGGRERTLFSELGEIDPALSPLDYLQDLAEILLRQNSCDVEEVTMTHAYVPILPYDPVTINYGDLTWTGNAENVSIQFEPGTRTQTRIRRVLYEEIEVEKGGAIVR